MGKFKKNKEDFVCERCNTAVVGDGYTNHCPACLWSKHVDINPGDRAETCGGIMEPIAVEGTTNHYMIVHRCAKCGLKKKNGVADRDNADALAGIALARAKKLGF